MSRTTSTRRPRVVQQRNLFGGVDVLEHYGDDGHTRVNQLHCASDVGASRAVAVALRLERAHDESTLPLLGTRARCPRCGHEGDALQDFGTRVLRGQRCPQSWCYACRGVRSKARANTG